MHLKDVLLCVCLYLMEAKYMFKKVTELLMGNSFVCVRCLSRLPFRSFYTDVIKWAVTAVTHLVESHFLSHQ